MTQHTFHLTTSALVGIVRTLFQIVRASFHIIRAPFQIVRTSFQIVRAPFQIVRASFQIVRAPFQIVHASFQIVLGANPTTQPPRPAGIVLRPPRPAGTPPYQEGNSYYFTKYISNFNYLLFMFGL